MPTVVIEQPFIKMELEGPVFFLSDESFVKMSPVRYRTLEALINQHVRQTTQTIEMIDSIARNGRFLAAVPLDIWLPMGTLTFEQRLLKNEFYLLKMQMVPK